MYESCGVVKTGALGGNRTPDALLRTEALYPLSYKGALALILYHAQAAYFLTGAHRW